MNRVETSASSCTVFSNSFFQQNPCSLSIPSRQDARITDSVSQILHSIVSATYLAKTDALEEEIYNHPNFQKYYAGIPKTEIYKLLFMERAQVEKGKFSFDSEEPGYLSAVLNGFHFMLDTLDLQLTPELFEELHDKIVEGLCTTDEPNGVPKGFRKYSDGGVAFGLDENGPLPTLSKRGYEEFLSRYNSYQYKDGEEVVYFLRTAISNPRYTITNDRHRQPIFDGTPPSQPVFSQLFRKDPSIKLRVTRPETCKADLKAIISIYQKAPKETERQKLESIGRLCQDMDQRHVFVDGNIRTTGIQLLNRELLRNGLKPSSMQDVNQLDCLHLAQIEEIDGPGIIEQIKEGQLFVQDLRAPLSDLQPPQSPS